MVKDAQQKLAAPVSTEKTTLAASKTEPKQKRTADELAKKQRDIGVAEFFARNKHLLGFDNPRKALLTAVKEAVDNALDASEEAGILPEVSVEVMEMAEGRFRIIIEDNGPGIVKAQIPKIFAKLLYGSKFHSRKQQRGQQGIGISAAVMYAQLTTGRPAKIISKTGPGKPAHFYELTLDTQRNEPKILKDEEREWDKEHGTRIELDIEGAYQKGGQSVDEYLKETAVTNPHVTIIYSNPKGENLVFARATEALPKEAKEIKPHPYGVELGVLLKMLGDTQYRTLQQFLTEEFSRVSPQVAKEICENARILPKEDPKTLHRDHAEALIKAIEQTKIMAPPTDCLSPIGAELLEKGLKKEVDAEFYAATTRDPVVYKGNPFQIEVALAYGGEQTAEGPIMLMRFANRVPLLYQQGACAVTKAVATTNWKAYGLQQSNGSLPSGPLTIAVHVASVWVPFTSESKEAIAHYEDIIKEIKLAVQEAGRDLQKYVHKKYRVHHQLERANLFERYIPEVANALSRLTGRSEERILFHLKSMVKKDDIQAEIQTMQTTNEEYDESWAKIGKEDDGSDQDPVQTGSEKTQKSSGEKKEKSNEKKDVKKVGGH